MVDRVPQRGWSAGLSVLLGVGVAVLVNLWTGNWEWPAGAGMAALALAWAGVEAFRAGHDDSKAGTRVSQKATSVRSSRLVGYERTVPESSLSVHQDLGVVQDATVVGIAGIPAPQESIQHPSETKHLSAE
jgi:hypothetical protein